MTLKYVMFIFVLLFTTVSYRSHPCHSSCENCDTSMPELCVTCDGGLVIDNDQCVGQPGINQVFQIIDHNWVSNMFVPRIDRSGTGGSANNAS